MEELPDTLLLRIFSFLTKTQLCQVALVCERWRRLTHDSSCWVSTDLRRYRHRLDETTLIKLIRRRMAPLLRKLDLGGFWLSPSVFQVLTRHCPELKVLCLETVTFVGDFADCAHSFPAGIQKLDIRYCSGHPSAFRKIAQSLRSTKCLGMCDELFESLSPHVQVRDVFVQLRELRVLEFSYCTSLTDYMVGLVAEFCSKLEALSMRRCNQIRGTTLNNLIDSCSALTSLVLDGTSLSDSAVRAVDWERSGLREVDLSWCRNMTSHGLKFMLPRLKHLQYLRLCCCGYGHAITDDVLMEMKRRKSEHLKVLDLSYSWDVTDKGLGEFLVELPSLLYLRIYHCRQLTPTFMDLIPEESPLLVVANFAVERLINPCHSLMTTRDSLVTTRDGFITTRDGLITTRDDFRRCVNTTTPVFLGSTSLDNQMD